jgi:YVTN family beta-propeller protein
VSKTLYVANSGDNTVSVIDYSTSETGGFRFAESNLTVGTSPGCITVNPNTNMVYVCNRDDNTVSIINGSTNKEVTIPVGHGPYAAAVNPNTDKVYVVCPNTDKVYVV